MGGRDPEHFQTPKLKNVLKRPVLGQKKIREGVQGGAIRTKTKSTARALKKKGKIERSRPAGVWGWGGSDFQLWGVGVTAGDLKGNRMSGGEDVRGEMVSTPEIHAQLG